MRFSHAGRSRPHSAIIARRLQIPARRSFRTTSSRSSVTTVSLLEPLFSSSTHLHSTAWLDFTMKSKRCTCREDRRRVRSTTQQAMVEFLRLDRDLLTAATTASPAPTNDRAAARRWVLAPNPRAKNEWLERAIKEPDLALGAELLRTFRQQTRTPPRHPGRRVADLLAAAEALRAKRAGAPALRPPRSPAATAKPQEH